LPVEKQSRQAEDGSKQHTIHESHHLAAGLDVMATNVGDSLLKGKEI
jgi:hypothetical protein